MECPFVIGNHMELWIETYTSKAHYVDTKTNILVKAHLISIPNLGT